MSTPLHNANSIAKLAIEGRISARQAAPLFGVTYPTLLNWIKADKIKAIRLGGRWMISSDEIHKRLSMGTEAPQAEPVEASGISDKYDQILNNYGDDDE
jgi:excisionase family DNA binding protein